MTQGGCCCQVVGTARKVEEAGCLSSELGGPVTTGSKELKGKTAAWCTFRNEVVIWGEEMEQDTVRREKPSLLRILRIILTIDVGFCKEVGVAAFSELSVWGMWKLLLQRAEVGHHLPWGPWHGLEPGAPHLLSCTDDPQQEADLSGLFAWRQDWLPWVQFEFAVTLPMKPRVSGGLQSWIHKEPGGLWLYSYLFR